MPRLQPTRRQIPIAFGLVHALLGERWTLADLTYRGREALDRTRKE